MRESAASTAEVKHLVFLGVVALAVTAFLPGKGVAPSTGPVSTALSSASAEDRARLSLLYDAMADLVERDGGKKLATTGQVRNVYSNSLEYAFRNTGIVGKYPGLSEAVESTLSKHYSLDNKSVDADLAKKIAAAFREVAAQCR